MEKAQKKKPNAKRQAKQERRLGAFVEKKKREQKEANAQVTQVRKGIAGMHVGYVSWLISLRLPE